MSTPDPTLPCATPPKPHDPYIALRNPNYRRYFIGSACSLFGTQMVGVAIALELYALTHSAFGLGLVGLVQVIPIVALALPAGHVVDRVNRKVLILVLTLILAFVSVLMGLSSLGSHAATPGPISDQVNRFLAWSAALFHDTDTHFTSAHVPVMYALLLASGVVRSFNQPAKQTIMPMLVPAEHFANAVTWSSTLFEITNVVGPAIAGVAIGLFLKRSPGSPWTYAVIYFFNAFAQLVQFANFLTIRLAPRTAAREPLNLRSLFAGVRFVYGDKIIFGVITLDMFAVLLGGATALVPVIAADVLQTGPIGVACLFAAPSAGAVTMAIIVAHMPPMRHAGRNLMFAVAGFGIATILFGLSTSLWLSLAALFAAGMCDNISVVVRHTLVQLRTPDEMRGRVNAVNSVFISTSNELGRFESGATASVSGSFLGPVLGPMAAVAAGGVGTILVVLGVAFLWPQLRRVGSLTDLDESEIEDLHTP